MDMGDRSILNCGPIASSWAFHSCRSQTTFSLREFQKGWRVLFSDRDLGLDVLKIKMGRDGIPTLSVYS